MMLLNILRWRLLLGIPRILGGRSAIPLIGTRQAVGLLILRMLVGSHVGSWLLGWWWEGRAHLN